MNLPSAIDAIMIGQTSISIIRLLPIIIRLFPWFRQSKLVRGLIIPINNVQESTDTELARALNLKTKIVPRKKFRDESHVIPLDRVKTCIEEQFNNTSLLKEFVLKAAKNLVGEATETAAQDLADRMMECVRDKCLKQTSARKRLTYRYSKREI
jgi:hypothetical protein